MHLVKGQDQCFTLSYRGTGVDTGLVHLWHTKILTAWTHEYSWRVVLIIRLWRTQRRPRSVIWFYVFLLYFQGRRLRAERAAVGLEVRLLPERISTNRRQAEGWGSHVTRTEWEIMTSSQPKLSTRWLWQWLRLSCSCLCPALFLSPFCFQGPHHNINILWFIWFTLAVQMTTFSLPRRARAASKNYTYRLKYHSLDTQFPGSFVL